MTLESLLLTALFVLTAVAFIGVLNARGVWRTSVAAVLALGCLGAALWQTQAGRALRAAEAFGVTGTVVLTGAAVSTSGYSAAGVAGPGHRSEAGSVAGADDGLGASEGIETGELVALVASARSLHDSLTAEDPARARALSDSAYQAFETRAEEYLSRARRLRERAARVAARPVVATSPAVSEIGEEVAESLSRALQSLAAATLDLRAFFRATGRDEEQRLTASFRREVDAAAEPLRRAAAGAGALSIPGGFEAREP